MKQKRKYNLFYAFAVEYPSIILELYRNGDISADTFNSVKLDNYNFIASLYLDYVLLKKPCSYDLENKKENINVFYNNTYIHFKIAVEIMKRTVNKINKKLIGKK